MKRIMTLVGGIIGTVFTAIFSLIMLIGITAILAILFDLGSGSMISALFALIGLLEIALGIVALVLNAMCIGKFSYTHEKYVAKRGLIITAIVFNFLLALLLIISLATQFSALTMFVFLACLATGVLYIVDMSLEKKRVAKAAATATVAEEKPE